jgi:SMC interacting uncharacterized protein involved in chromosome segregation
MELPQTHELAEEQAKLALEVQEYRRELDGLLAQKSDFIEEREKEALEAIETILEASSRVLSEAISTAKSVNAYNSALSGAKGELIEARASFSKWKDDETEKIDQLKVDCEKKVEEMRKTTEDLIAERLRLSLAKKDLDYSTAINKQEFEKMRKEREKLVRSKKLVNT